MDNNSSASGPDFTVTITNATNANATNEINGGNIIIMSSTITPDHLMPIDSLEPTEATVLWATYNVVLMVCILAGNTFTIIAVRTCRRLRAIISNLFILSLAVSDFIVGVAVPYHTAFYLGSNMGQSRALCLLRFYSLIFACATSILTLISIAVDRYIAIVYALHYRRYMTRRMALMIIAFNWLTGATVALIPMFWNHFDTAAECEFNEVMPRWYMAGLLTPGFAMVWLIMILLYWRIMREASRQAIQLRNSQIAPRMTNLQIDWKSAQIVIIIMGCFSICWLPYVIVACGEVLGLCRTPPFVYKCTISLAMTNSGLNPIVYAWKNSNFRTAFVQLLHGRSPNCPTTADMMDHISQTRPGYSRQASKESMEYGLHKVPTASTISTIPSSPQRSPTIATGDCSSTIETCPPASHRQPTILATIQEDTGSVDLSGGCVPCGICKNLLRKTKQLTPSSESRHRLAVGEELEIFEDKITKTTTTTVAAGENHEDNSSAISGTTTATTATIDAVAVVGCGKCKQRKTPRLHDDNNDNDDVDGEQSR